MKRYSKGFTLIELLVVIAIIGILASVILASLNSARVKARDSYRASSIGEMQTALAIYYTDHGTYPSTGGQWWGNCTAFGSHDLTGANGYIPNLAPTYIASLALDPKPMPPDGCILYRSDSADYFLMIYKTYEGKVPDNRIRPATPTEKDYAVYTGGASSW